MISTTGSNFSDFGKDFQLDLLHEIIADTKFGETVIDMLEPIFFPSDSFAKLIFLIKNYYQKHETILNFPNLRVEVNAKTPDSQGTLKIQLLDLIDQLENRKSINGNVHEYTLKFCKLQALKSVVNDIKPKLDRGILFEYDEIETKLRSALIFKDIDDSIDVFHNIDNVLTEVQKERIPTGISGIDDLISGGLAKGEMALVIAPLGVGKTTFLTKVANTAYLTGEYNVLQVFFEDKPEAIQSKHFSIMSEVPLSELTKKENLNLVKTRVNKVKQRNTKNNLFIQKLPADGVTVAKIKNIIKKLNAKGTKIDLLVLDYVDCLSLEKESYQSEEWSNEGKIMRQLETMVEEMDVVCWTATQGNRASTNMEVVRTENMGGSLKKAQIAHFIMSIGKTLEQKEAKRATISILKNRMGADGMVFENCVFDNGILSIDTKDLLSEIGFEEKKTKEILKRNAQRIRDNRDDDGLPLTNN